MRPPESPDWGTRVAVGGAREFGAREFGAREFGAREFSAREFSAREFGARASCPLRLEALGRGYVPEVAPANHSKRHTTEKPATPASRHGRSSPPESSEATGNGWSGKASGTTVAPAFASAMPNTATVR